MRSISNISSDNFFKITGSIIITITILAIAFLAIKLIISIGDSKFINSTNYELLLGISSIVLILDLLSLTALCKKRKSPSQSISSLALLFPDQSAPRCSSLSISETVLPKLKPNTFISNLNIVFLSYLDLETLDKCSQIEGWEIVINDPLLWNNFDLKILFPNLKIFDERDWKIHADLLLFDLDVSDAPPLDQRTLIRTLYRLSSLSIEEDAGLTLLTIPKGLTPNKLITLALFPKQGHGTAFGSISHKLGDVPINHTYRIVITNSVLQNSRSVAIEKGEAFVNKFGCKMPNPLEVMTLIATTYMRSEKWLYKNVYTVCSGEEVHEQYGFMTGVFSAIFVCARAHFRLMIDNDDEDTHANSGYACVCRSFIVD